MNEQSLKTLAMALHRTKPADINKDTDIARKQWAADVDAIGQIVTFNAPYDLDLTIFRLWCNNGVPTT